MAPGLDFASVLAQKFDEACVVAAGRGRAGASSTGSFWLSDPGLSFQLAGAPVESAPRAHAYPRAVSPRVHVPRGQAPAASRPGCLRTAAEREAAALFERLGGPRLGRVFFEDELKRAYRALARRVHPDAHPACLPDQRRRLAASFAALTGAYRTLLSTMERPPR